MKKTCLLIALFFIINMLSGCSGSNVQIVATTLPVYEFTVMLCQGTNLTVGRLINENISCLHDYSLQVSQMQMIESADIVIISGAGLEDAMIDTLENAAAIVDASVGVPLLDTANANTHDHAQEHGHNHSAESDPHIWLSPKNACLMAQNICSSLCRQYPQYSEIFQENLLLLLDRLNALQQYGEETLSSLSCREMITFHDGFSYFADSFGLTILHAIEEESGREASAAELIHLIEIVEHHSLPAIFIEENGSLSAADIISCETGVPIYALNMAMSGDSYFSAMYRNIDTVKEALK